jgi:hypothetical protein
MKTVTTTIFFACLIFIMTAPLVSGSHGMDSHDLRAASDQSARMVDEYGDLIQDDEGARLDAFENELKKESNSKGYIIAYGGSDDSPGKARRYALRARAYLIQARAIAASRIAAVDGGRREALTVELWIVPAGARAPVPTPTITGGQRTSHEAHKYDGYSYGYGESWNRYEDLSIRLDGFATALQIDPGARGYIIAYAQNGDDRIGIECDPAGKARKIARTEKMYLIQKWHFDPTRIVALDGGYSPIRTVELWIIPTSARPPVVRPSRCR